MTTCGPYVCQFPKPVWFQPGAPWTCPKCGTRYRLTKPKPERWWRNWSAEHGHWIVETRVNAWWQERRAQREADEDAAAKWFSEIATVEDNAPDHFGPVKLPGQRYHGRHAQPGDIPDQPAGGAE